MPGPGEYVGDETEGVVDPKDLPQPIVELRSRSYRRRPCPQCGKSCYRDSVGSRLLHDRGNHLGRPRDIRVMYSKHRC